MKFGPYLVLLLARNYTSAFGEFIAALMTALCTEEFSKEPRESFRASPRLTDYELFMKHCVDAEFNLLGDMWLDATHR